VAPSIFLELIHVCQEMRETLKKVSDGKKTFDQQFPWNEKRSEMKNDHANTSEPLFPVSRAAGFHALRSDEKFNSKTFKFMLK
jgi:hypothetical protein